MQPIEKLKNSKAMNILIALYKYGEMGLAQLLLKTDGSTAIISHRVTELQMYGLIEEKQEKKFQGRRLFKLTKDGEYIAKRLVEIEGKLGK